MTDLTMPPTNHSIMPSTPRIRAGFAMLWVVVTLAALTGCDAPPPTDTDDVLDYVRNGLYGAKVRRLDATAQEYVDDIFSAYRKWTARCAPIEKLIDLDALEPIDSDKWRETERIKETLDAIQEFKADAPDPENKSEDAKTRAELFDAIATAVENAPPLPMGETNDLPAAITELLNVDQEKARIDTYADRFETLYAVVNANADNFDTSKTGLAFKSPDIARKAADAWNQLHDALAEDRQRDIEWTREILAEEPDIRNQALQAKNDLRVAGLTDERDRRKTRRLELEIEYHDARIKAAEARQRKFDDAAKSDE